MTMDVLTNAALDNLNKNALPRLQKALVAIQAQSPDARSATPELKKMLMESADLISMLLKWVNGGSDATKPSITENLSNDDEAMLAAIEGMDSTIEGLAESSQSPESAPGDGPLNLDDDLVIAGMDAPASDAAPSGDISDDEARRLLAEMDAPAAPPAGGDMSDDEAKRLLAAMDEPSAPATGNDMSDDEARRLLADMDAPQTAAPKAAPAPQAKPKTATKPATAPATPEKK